MTGSAFLALLFLWKNMPVDECWRRDEAAVSEKKLSLDIQKILNRQGMWQSKGRIRVNGPNPVTVFKGIKVKE